MIINPVIGTLYPRDSCFGYICLKKKNLQSQMTYPENLYQLPWPGRENMKTTRCIKGIFILGG